MRVFIFPILFIVCAFRCAAQDDSLFEEKHVRRVVANFADAIKNDQRAKVADMISYPFNREYPIPSIQTKAEFLTRYKEVFDDSLIKLIAKSNIKKDWSAVGWRGIMLFNGQVWIDYDGRLIAVNYQSKQEAAILRQKIEEDRKTLFDSLRIYEKPVLLMETKKYLVRIDQLEPWHFRYASWTKPKGMNERPDLVLTGKREFDGTGGNHYYTLKKGRYAYICRINYLRAEETPPASLDVMEGEKEILSEPAISLKN